jgi:DNA helicase-2/ATP-dependent DNA helicase PcrA
VFSFGEASKNSEASKAIEVYGKICNTVKLREEARLGYVAFTRARTHLIATTSWWRDGAKMTEPSSIFQHVFNVAEKSGRILNNYEKPEDGSKNPRIENPLSGIWPIDPLGQRRDSFERAAATVRAAKPFDLSKVQRNQVSNSEDINSWAIDAAALISEFKLFKSQVLKVTLPARLSTSTLVRLHENSEALAEDIRRPMPRTTDQYSRRGTAFHLWVEHHFGAATLFDDEDLDFLDPLEEDVKLEELKANWLSSEWAHRSPVAVEVPFESVINGTLIRGRIDAVYQDGTNFEVVDWKTGSKKLGQSAAIQLAMYRLAWSKLRAVDISKVSAAFHYVPTSITDRPADLMSEAELIKLLDL